MVLIIKDNFLLKEKLISLMLLKSFGQIFNIINLKTNILQQKCKFCEYFNINFYNIKCQNLNSQSKIFLNLYHQISKF